MKGKLRLAFLVLALGGWFVPSPAVAITFVQDAQNLDDSGATSTTIAATWAAATTTGHLVVGWCGWNDPGTANLLSVTDSQGNAYSLIGAKIRSPGDIQSHQLFFSANITGGAGSVTCTLSELQNFRRIGIAEYSGVATTAPLDGNANNFQAGAPTTTDGVTSTSITTTAAGDLIFAATQNVSDANPGGATISAGTGFTARKITGTGNGIGRMEDGVQAAAGAIAGTFTISLSKNMLTGVAAFKALVCAAVPDASYVAANAQSTQAIVYWSSANPVIILRKTAAFAGEAPVNGTAYTAGTTIGAATVVYDGTTAVAGTTCTATSCTQTGLTNGTTYYYMVFAKTGTGGSSCYAPGTVNTTPGVSARPAASPPAWSYMLAGGSMLKGGTAGNGALYVTSNASQIVSLNTANGTQSWAPAATTSPVQGWLTWIPPGPALVQQKTASVTSAQSLSLTLTSAPGNNRLLVMVGAALNGSLTVGTGVTGGGVATWTLASKSTTNTNVEIWYGITNGSSSTVTISTTAAAGQMWMHVSEWSGMATTGVLDQASAQPGTTSPASAPSITTTNANDLLIFGVGDKLPNTFGTPTPGTWTAMTSISITTRMQAEWYRVVSTTGAYAPTVSETGLAWDAAIAAFKASAAGGIAETVIGGDQSGKVYSVNTTTGATNWQVALTGADAIQAAVAAQIRSFSNAAFQAAYTDDVLFATTLNSAGAFTTNNKIFARRVSDGAVLWTFNSALTSSVDGIVGMPYVDYAQNRLYVASRAGSAGTQQSLWVLNTLDGTLVACPGCTGLGHLETSPTLSFNGLTLYVGSTAGTLYAINAATLTLKWSLALGTAITGFVWEDYTTTGRLYFAAADGTVRCIQDTGTSGTACTGWTSPTVPVPSTPLLLGKLFVGSWNAGAAVGQKGQLYQINLTTGAVEKTVVVGDGERQPGDASTETTNEVFVGTTEGKIFKFSLTAGSL